MYTVEVRELEPVRVAYIPYEGMLQNANKVFPQVFKAIRGKTCGAPFFRYITMDASTQTGRIELCVPTQEEPTQQGVCIQTLPAVTALCTTHRGGYDTMGQAYTALEQHAAENGYCLQPPFCELFIKGPGMIIKGNPDHYITEIQFPIGEV